MSGDGEVCGEVHDGLGSFGFLDLVLLELVFMVGKG